MLNHPSYNDRYRKVFSLPVKNGGVSIFLTEDRANKHERSIRICKPLRNHNAIDTEFQQKIIRKIWKEKQEQTWEKTLAIKDHQWKSDKFSKIGYGKRNSMLAKRTSIEKIFWFDHG